MQEGYQKLPGGNEWAKWCSLLLANASMMDSATNLDDAMSILARNMIAQARVESCIILVRCAEDWLCIATKQGVHVAGIERIVQSRAVARLANKSEPCVVPGSDLELFSDGEYIHTDILCIPLVSRGKSIGLALLYTAGKPHAFPGSTIGRLSAMAIQGAHAVAEFNYRDELQKRRDEMRRVYEIQRRITESIDLEKATESIVENAPYITRLQYCMVFLLDPSARHIISVKAPEQLEKKFGKLTFDLDELIASRIAVNERKPFFIEDSRTYPQISKHIVRMMNSTSVIILPLLARGRVLGVMWLFTTGKVVHFDDEDKRRAIALSDQAAGIIDNARVFKELEESYEKLKDLDRTKMEFFTLISHELRNPLAIIKGYTELLYDGTLGEMNDKQKEKLARIRENVDKLADMVGKMSEISSLESRQYNVDRSFVSLGDMIGDLTDTMSFLFKNKHIELDVKIPENLPLVEVDQKKMEQVILNLLNNALKYTPEGGHVTIAAEDRVSDILVRVSDTGIGIPKKDLDKIFSGFYHSGYKLSYEYKGPGLGLAISRKIIEGHGGHIWAKSEVGKGSTFYFTIPKHIAGEGTAAGVPASMK